MVYDTKRGHTVATSVLVLGDLCLYDPYESEIEPYLHSIPHCIYSECFTMD